MSKYNRRYFLFVGLLQLPVVGLLIYDTIYYPDNFLGYLFAQLILFLVLGIPVLKMLYIALMVILLNIPPIRHRIEKSEWYNRY
jgi:hypothetical protein